jgi:hypothetical protein
MTTALALRRHFGVPGDGGDPVQYAVDLGPLRLVVLDTKRNGEERGQLDTDRLGWLEATLAAAPEAPTLLALHHAVGIRAFDEVVCTAKPGGSLGNLDLLRAEVEQRLGDRRGMERF